MLAEIKREVGLFLIVPVPQISQRVGWQVWYD